MAFLPTFHHRVPAVFVYENFGGFHCHLCGEADMRWPPCKTVLRRDYIRQPYVVIIQRDRKVIFPLFPVYGCGFYVVFQFSMFF